MPFKTGEKNKNWNGFVRSHSTWNKGTHIQTNNALDRWRTSGGQPWNKGKHPECFQGRNHPMFGVHRLGKDSPTWKGGLPKCIDCNKLLSSYVSIRCKKCSGKDRSGANTWNWKGGVSKHKFYNRYLLFKRRYKVGILKLKTIQQIYEDNIKQYGTLTCYLCEKPIEFGQDCIEHKIPISRGGTNARDNLAIAHRSCNAKKHTKTEEEFRKEISLCD